MEITNKQIEELQAEATEAGDWAMVAICRTALGRGNPTWQKLCEARDMCADVVEDARLAAMD